MPSSYLKIKQVHKQTNDLNQNLKFTISIVEILLNNLFPGNNL